MDDVTKNCGSDMLPARLGNRIVRLLATRSSAGGGRIMGFATVMCSN